MLIKIVFRRIRIDKTLVKPGVKRSEPEDLCVVITYLSDHSQLSPRTDSTYLVRVATDTLPALKVADGVVKWSLRRLAVILDVEALVISLNGNMVVSSDPQCLMRETCIRHQIWISRERHVLEREVRHSRSKLCLAQR